MRFFVAYLHSGSEMATAGLLSIILGVAAGLLALVWTWVSFDTGHSSKSGQNVWPTCIVCIPTYLAVSILMPTFGYI